VIALEYLAAAQAMDLHPRDTRFGEGTTAMHNFVRDQIPFRTQDTEFYPDLERVIALVENSDPLEVYASCCQSTMISDNIL
jgi:histidine ammonia-lyase